MSTTLPVSAPPVQANPSLAAEVAAFAAATSAAPVSTTSPVPVIDTQTAALAAEQAAEAEASARIDADRVLKQAAKAYARGERALCAGHLEAGRLSDDYIHRRLALGDKRAKAVEQVAAELGRFSSAMPDVNRLVLCYHASRLLAVEPGVKADLPYGHYRDAYAQLVERQAKDTAAECYVLLPGMEAECQALFVRAQADSLSKIAVQDAVQGITRTYADRQAAAAKQAADKAKADRDSTAQAARDQAARESAAQADKDAAERSLQTASKTADAEVLSAALEASIQTLQAEQDKQRQLDAAAELAAKEADRKDREQKDRDEAARKLQDKLRRKAEKDRAHDSPKKSAPPAGNLMSGQKSPGTAKDVGENAAELIQGCEAPDDALEACLAVLASSKELSASSKRAVQAALVILARQTAPAPSPNGQKAVA